MKILNRNSFVLLLLAILFVAPGIVAYFVYTHPQWLGMATTNKGELIKSPQILDKLGSEKKWRLIVWSPEGCDATCIQQVDKLARIRLALGRHYMR